MASNTEDILREIGWTGNGYKVPIANAENKALEAEVQKLIVRKQQAKGAFEDATSKFNALDKHFKYLQQEAEHNQKLLIANVQHIEAERHKNVNLTLQVEKVNHDIRRVHRNLEEISERQKGKRKDLARVLEKIEKLKMESTWDTAAVQAWKDSVKKRDDDTDLLNQLSKLDERKAKELEMRQQKLQTDLSENKRGMEKLMSEITNYENMLQKTEKLCKHQGKERKTLILQWQESVRNLKQKDADIRKVNENLVQAQILIEQRQAYLEDENGFLKDHQTRNKDMEEEIGNMHNFHSRARRELSEFEEFVLLLTTDVNTLKRALVVVSGKLQKERQTAKDQEQELSNIHEKISNLMVQNLELETKLNKVQNCSTSASEREEHHQKMFDAEQTMITNSLFDIKKVEGILYRNQINFEKLVIITKNKESEITIVNASKRRLEKEILTKTNEVNVLKERIFKLEYKVSETETIIAGFGGTLKLDDEAVLMNEQIVKLESELAERNEFRVFLQNQITKMQAEMRRLGQTVSADFERLEQLRNKVQDQILCFNGGVKQAAAVKKRYQQKQVDHNLLQLHVSQLETSISSEENNIYDLQTFRLRMESSLKARQIEIKSYIDIVQAEKKNLEEARGRLRADINHKKIRVEQFQNKHNLALVALGTDDDGQPLSIIHFKVQDAQERRMLQQESDELNNKIRKTEKEIIAMENTVKLVDMTNDAFKKSLTPIEERCSELEINSIGHDICNVGQALCKKKKDFLGKRRDVKSLLKELDDLQAKWKEEQKKLEELETVYQNIKDEKTIANEKMMKTLNTIKKYKTSAIKRDIRKPEKNLHIRVLQDSNKSALRQLAKFIGEHEEKTSMVLDFLQHYNIELPSETKTRTSISSSSIATLTTSSHRSSYGSVSCSALSQLVLSFNYEQ